jgi:hypothetical protein
MSAIKRFIAVLLFLFLVTPCFSQPGSNPGGGGKPGGVPITGIEILVAVGGLIGLKKIFDSRKSK